MKPPFHRYVLAHTAGVSAGIGVMAALLLMLAGLRSEGTLVSQPGVLVWIVLAAIPMAAIGWVFGMAFLWAMLGPLAARLQGWPFAVGDRVWILSGVHKNRLTTVYEVWMERGQVRVVLGSEQNDKVKDVYCAVAVCRAKSTHLEGTPNENQPICSETNLPSHAAEHGSSTESKLAP